MTVLVFVLCVNQSGLFARLHPGGTHCDKRYDKGNMDAICLPLWRWDDRPNYGEDHNHRLRADVRNPTLRDQFNISPSKMSD